MANKIYLKPDAEYISFYSNEEILTNAGGVSVTDPEVDVEQGNGGNRED